MTKRQKNYLESLHTSISPMPDGVAFCFAPLGLFVFGDDPAPRAALRLPWAILFRPLGACMEALRGTF